MPSLVLAGFVLILLLALSFEFINGFHDTANAIATSVSTRVLAPRQAIFMAASLNFVGALASTKVAKTISSGLVAGSVAQYVIAAALAAAIIWNLVTWYLGLPSSSSHALIGGLLGASIIDAGGFGTIIWGGVMQKIVFPLFASPVIGFIVAYLFMSLLFEILRPLSQYTVNKWFSKLQIVSAGFMAFSHGSNDAQKTIGIIALTIMSFEASHPGHLPHWLLPTTPDGIPLWVIILCAITIAAGTSFGGWKIIKTLGVNFVKLQPIGGFAAETAAAIVIESATFFGAPVSTTHVITSSIMGVGSARRFSSVRWTVGRSIVVGWFVTLPTTMLIGGLITLLLKNFVF